MKKVVILLSLLFFCFPLFSEVKKVIDSEIKLASFYKNEKGHESPRMFIVGNTIFRNIDELLEYLSKQENHPSYPTRYVIHSSDIVLEPSRNFSDEEITKIKELCFKKNLRFFHYLGG